MKKDKHNDKFEVGYHVVAFLDLMGQQEKLRKLSKLPEQNNDEEYNELLDTLKQTYGAINGMRKSFKGYFDGFQKKRFDINKLPLDKRQLYKELTNNPIQIHQFSDFVMAFMSLRTDQGAKLPIRGILAIIGATAITSLVCLASSHPLRGGMDIGVNLNIKSNEIYGASIARAYALESHVSNYPRVTIGDELHEYIKTTASQSVVDEKSKASAILAKECLSLLTVDYDGYVMVDFMGKNVRNRLNEIDGLDSIEVAQKAYDFVNKSSTDFRKAKNTKLASKYALLKIYMESRIHLWNAST